MEKEDDSSTIYHNGIPIMKVNVALLKKVGKMDNLDKIKDLHGSRIKLEVIMLENLESKEILQASNKLYDVIEGELQDAWGFSRDKNYFRFWKRPGCRCPVMDNEDRYPAGSYITTESCLIHWDK